MRVNIIEVMQTYIRSNVEPETNPVVVVIWREGEAISHAAGGGSIGSDNGLVSLISECYQKIENGDESGDIEKRERSFGSRFQAPIEVDSPVMERIERRTVDLRRETRGVWKPPAIRMEDIERPHRYQKYLKCKE
jgi:hypothetical protein